MNQVKARSPPRAFLKIPVNQPKKITMRENLIDTRQVVSSSLSVHPSHIGMRIGLVVGILGIGIYRGNVFLARIEEIEFDR